MARHSQDAADPVAPQRERQGISCSIIMDNLHNGNDDNTTYSLGFFVKIKGDNAYIVLSGK